MLRWKRERVPECGAIDDEGDLSAERYGEIMLKRLGEEYRRFARFVVESGGKAKRILEVGPGPGWVSVFVAEAVPDAEIVAVDASSDMARACAANFAAAGLAGRARVVVGVVERLGESVAGPFDVIYTRDSLHHWIDPVAGFRNIRSLLAPGGVLVLGDERRDLAPAARALVAVLSRRMGTMGRFWRSSLAAAYTPAELGAMLAEAGFKDARVRGSFLDVSAAATKAG